MSLLFSKSYETSSHFRVFTLIDEVNDGILTAEELVTGKSLVYPGKLIALFLSLLAVLEDHRGPGFCKPGV